MSRSTRNAFLLAFIVFGVFLGTAASTGMFATTVNSSAFTVGRSILETAYPEIFGKRFYIRFSSGSPVDRGLWDDFSGFEFKVQRFSPGASFDPVYDVQSSKIDPSPENPVFLEGSFWINNPSGRVIRVLLDGDLACSKQNEAIRKLVQSHPEWSDQQDIAALKKEGARFGPENKDSFARSLDLQRFEKAFGRLTIKSVNFSATTNAQHEGTFTDLKWTVRAEAAGEDGHRSEYAFVFEPFQEKLVSVFEVTYTPSLSAHQQTSEAAGLFEQLQSQTTTDAAKDALLKKAEKDNEVRDYLRTNLPIMVAKGWKNAGEQWMNAVRLAGELKIAEAAPALGKWISFDAVGSETSAGQFQRLETNPAGKALAQIGDPAIPTLTGILENGSLRERRNAYFALNLINSPQARAAIHARSDRESDAHLKEFIRKTPE